MKGIEKFVDCPDCDGTGYKPGSSKSTCKDCNGNGQVRVRKNMGGNIDWSDIVNMQHGYDVSKARTFEKELKELLERYDLIYIGKERAAGEDYNPEKHDNSDTTVDRLVPIIVSELIHILKEKQEDA